MDTTEKRERATFLEDTAGVVSVDWVVLTGAVVGLGLAVIVSISTGTNAVADNVTDTLLGASVAGIGSLGAAPDS